MLCLIECQESETCWMGLGHHGMQKATTECSGLCVFGGIEDQDVFF